MNSSASTHVPDQQQAQQQQDSTLTTNSSPLNVSNSSNLGSGLANLVNRVQNNILHSNTFLRSDLDTLINTESNNSSVIANGNSSMQMQNFNRSSNSPYVPPHHLHHHHHHQQQQPHGHNHSHVTPTDGDASNGQDQIVLNLQTNGNENGLPNDQQQQQQQQQQQPANPEQAPNFILFFMQALQSSLPFFIILVAKIFHQHLLGFFIVLGFVTTLHWSNKTLVRQVELKVS